MGYGVLWCPMEAPIVGERIKMSTARVKIDYRMMGMIASGRKLEFKVKVPVTRILLTFQGEEPPDLTNVKFPGPGTLFNDIFKASDSLLHRIFGK